MVGLVVRCLRLLGRTSSLMPVRLVIVVGGMRLCTIRFRMGGRRVRLGRGFLRVRRG